MISHQPTNSLSNFNYNAFIYSDTVYASHFHSNYELIYALCGTIDICVGGQNHTLQQGEAVLVSSIRNFNRVFKNLSGMTPMQYKAKKNG